MPLLSCRSRSKQLALTREYPACIPGAVFRHNDHIGSAGYQCSNADSQALGGSVHRQALSCPRLKSSDHVGGAVQAESAQRVRGQARGVTLGTQHDHLGVVAGGLRESGRAFRIKAPLQVVALDQQRGWNFSLPGALPAGADVDE